MEVLAVFDEKNYDDTTKVYEKYNVRGVIFRDGKIAMQCILYLIRINLIWEISTFL